MLSSLIMMGLVLFLVAVLVVGIQEQENNHFFDKENTNALRGFWCLIVVLVHIPLLYQNRIQDMIGSLQPHLCTIVSTLLRPRTSSMIVRWLQRTSRIWSTNCSAATARRNGSVHTLTTV